MLLLCVVVVCCSCVLCGVCVCVVVGVVVVVRDTAWCVYVHSTPACIEPKLIEKSCTGPGGRGPVHAPVGFQPTPTCHVQVSRNPSVGLAALNFS